MKNNEYQCAVCQGVFEKGWTDEEATEELKNNFGDYNTEDCDIVCDDCYNKMNEKSPFIDFKESRDSINKLFEDNKIKTKEIEGFTIKDYDSLSDFMYYKMEEAVEKKLLDNFQNFADIRDIKF